MFSLTMLMLKTRWMKFFLFLLTNLPNISLSTVLTSNEVTINVAERCVQQSTINIATLMFRAALQNSLMIITDDAIISLILMIDRKISG